MEAVTPEGERVDNEINKPVNILEEIVWYKDVELQQRKEKFPLELVRTALQNAPPARDFVGAIRSQLAETGQPALIAEVKKASPSKGVIQPNFDPVKIERGVRGGRRRMPLRPHRREVFPGRVREPRADPLRGRHLPPPVQGIHRRRDRQIYLARKYGADAILLIAAVLPNQDLKYFTKIAKSLGMAALIEVHTYEEMERVLQLEDLELLGINNAIWARSR